MPAFFPRILDIIIFNYYNGVIALSSGWNDKCINNTNWKRNVILY